MAEVLIHEPTVEQATEEQKSQAKKGRLVSLGLGTREGWTGELPFYLFQCPRCEQLGVDYPHGFPENKYLVCQCGIILRCSL